MTESPGARGPATANTTLSMYGHQDASDLVRLWRSTQKQGQDEGRNSRFPAIVPPEEGRGKRLG
jgi:hypothetical protein